MVAMATRTQVYKDDMVWLPELASNNEVFEMDREMTLCNREMAEE